MKPIVSLQCMRALAAILVVIFHHMNMMREGPVPTLPRFDIGEFGVDIFFVISGFIMWSTTMGRGITGLSFLLRRILRIVPLYWALTFATVFVSTRGGLALNFDVDYLRLAKSLLFIPQWNGVFPNIIAPYLIVGWTLELEMFFYVIFAGALYLSEARRLVAVLSIFSVLTMIGLVTLPTTAVFKAYTNDIILEFAMGVLLGWLYQSGRLPLSSAVGSVLAIVGLGLVLLLRDNMKARFIYYGIAAFLLVWTMLTFEKHLKGSAWSLPRFLGDASYSIYLSHMMAMAVSWKLISLSFAASFTTLTLVLQTTFAVVVGAIVYLIVERPLMQATKCLPLLRTHSSSIARSA